MYLKRQTFFVFGLSRSGSAGAEFLLSKKVCLSNHIMANCMRKDVAMAE